MTLCLERFENAGSDRVQLAKILAELDVKIESGCDPLEAAARVMGDLRTHLGILRRDISALSSSQDQANERSRNEAVEEARKCRLDARALLTALALDFVEQHEAALQEACAPYVMIGQQRPMKFFPYFTIYRRNIRRFELEPPADSAVLLDYLALAVAGKDFLAPRRPE